MSDVAIPLQVASGLCWVNAVGFGVFCLPAIRNVSKGLDLPIVFGYTAYGGGAFERVGIRSSVWLLAAFLLVCVLEGVAGWLLWGGHQSGAILALALLVPGAVFWWGFSLPIPPLFALVRTVLILLSWKSLT
jgi:hypothetical protein